MALKDAAPLFKNKDKKVEKPLKGKKTSKKNKNGTRSKK
jgi:hypothetical protein